MKHYLKKRLIVFIYAILILIFVSSCKKDFFIVHFSSSPNVPILSIKLSPIVDLQQIEKTDVKSLIPMVLEKGVEHNLVINLQDRLMACGFMEEDKASNYFGDTTEEAIKKLQRQLKMDDDGICTPKIYDLLMSKDAPTYEAKRGYSGSDITVLQQRLYELSFLLNDTDVSGFFGEKTETAVKEMQKTNKIEETGVIDLKTYKLLFDDTVIPYTINSKSKPSIIKIYQQKLNKLGYYMGDIDGKYNTTFRKAVKEYQSANLQLSDGLITPSTKFSIDSVYAKPYIIYIGMRGGKILDIQNRLIELGYIEDNMASGYYGEYTAQGLAYFQKRNGMDITGIIDGETEKVVFSEEAIPSDKVIKWASQFVMDTKDIMSKEEKPLGNADDLVRVAGLKLGSKYVWGAKGPKTFDCSGFVYWCLNQVGVDVQYMTTYNWRFTTQFEKVEKFDDLEMGDLIIINGHMGIVADDMTVIDASSSNGKVVHRDLDDWWRERFLMGFKIFK